MYLYSFARAAITKDHVLGGLNNTNLLSQGPEGQQSEIRVLAELISPRPLSLAIDGHPLPVSSQGLPSVAACVQMSSSSFLKIIN